MSSPGTAACSGLRRAISGVVAPSQPAAQLPLAFVFACPERTKGVLHRLEITSTMSQLESILHGRGVRGGLGVNAFKQLSLNMKVNSTSPFCSSALAECDEVCLCLSPSYRLRLWLALCGLGGQGACTLRRLLPLLPASPAPTCPPVLLCSPPPFGGSTCQADTGRGI